MPREAPSSLPPCGADSRRISTGPARLLGEMCLAGLPLCSRAAFRRRRRRDGRDRPSARHRAVRDAGDDDGRHGESGVREDLRRGAEQIDRRGRTRGKRSLEDRVQAAGSRYRVVLMYTLYRDFSDGVADARTASPPHVLTSSSVGAHLVCSPTRLLKTVTWQAITPAPVQADSIARYASGRRAARVVPRPRAAKRTFTRPTRIACSHLGTTIFSRFDCTDPRSRAAGTPQPLHRPTAGAPTARTSTREARRGGATLPDRVAGQEEQLARPKLLAKSHTRSHRRLCRRNLGPLDHSGRQMGPLAFQGAFPAHAFTLVQRRVSSPAARSVSYTRSVQDKAESGYPLRSKQPNLTRVATVPDQAV